MYSNARYGQSYLTSIIQEMRMRKRRVIVIVSSLIAVFFFIKVKGSPFREEREYHFFSVPVDTELQHEVAQLRQQIGRYKRLALNCEKFKVGMDDPHLPTIYAITPTYARPAQKAELTRLSHTFLLVPNFHWIIVEDAESKTPLVSHLLAKSGVKYTQIAMPTPKEWKLREKEPNWRKPRGVLQRNAALQWLRDNLDPKRDNGVLYFADDDNTYALDLFEEMRFTKTVSVWPVGLVGGLMVEKPLLNSKGKVIGWNSVWKPERPFPVDMAGFAINLKLFFDHPSAKFSFDVQGGYQESVLLKQLVSWEQLETKADNCTKIYVWHTRTEPAKLKQEEKLRKKGQPSDSGMEV